MAEPQKPHLTGEFVVVAYNGGHVLLHLISNLVTVVSEAVGRQADENKDFDVFLFIHF